MDGKDGNDNKGQKGDEGRGMVGNGREWSEVDLAKMFITVFPS
jgi:hypothetical protein